MKRTVKHWIDEDVVSRYWRSVNFWQRGELRKAKRRYNKNERREGKREASNYE